MALSVARSRVKERCGVADTAYDTVIDHLIADTVPAVEYAIRDELLADTGNAGLQATLNLGALEIVTGEFAALRLREPGGSEHVRVGDLEVVPFRGYDPADPFGQIRHGWRRLRPYLKVDPAVPTFVGMGSSGRRGVEEPE